jgi:glutathione synthase
MRHLFVMDPLATINVRGDSTYVTMRECTDRGRAIAFCTPADLFVIDGVAWARCTPLTVHADAPHFRCEAAADEPFAAFDVVWMRKDPPFDMPYVLATYVLDLAPPTTFVVNDPLGLKRWNEKLFAMRFPAFHPHVLLSRDKARLRRFVEEEPGKAVLKPWDGNGGRGVIVVEKGDKNLPALIELITTDGRDFVLAQRYLDGIVRGDKRIILFDGEPVACVLRVPSEQDHRGNIHVGARVEASELTAREREICAALGPVLRDNGLLFVGIDVIDGYLTEINVTSPTGLQEANRLYGGKLEARLVDVVEAAAGRRRA